MILALIGAGKWGKNYLRAVKNIPDVVIKYVCSGSNSLKNISPEYTKLLDYEELIKKEDLDGVIIAVPPIKHFEIAEFFLLENKPVLVEKPMVASLREAKKLKAIMKSKKGMFMVGNIFLYNDAFQAFEKLFRKIKKVYYLHFEGCDNGPARKDVSALWDWASHDLSMCLELLGSPSAVCAWGLSATRPDTNFYDMVYVRLLFKNNISAFLRMGWLSPIKKREILAVGEEEFLLFNDVVDKKIVHFDKVLRGKEISHTSNEPLVNELKDFVEMIKKDRNPKSDFKKNLSIIEIIDAIERSIKNKGKVIAI